MKSVYFLLSVVVLSLGVVSCASMERSIASDEEYSQLFKRAPSDLSGAN